MANYGGFSWKRLSGVSRVKRQIGQSIGVPLTRSGRQRKIGGMCCGCMFPVILMLVASIAFAVTR